MREQENRYPWCITAPEPVTIVFGDGRTRLGTVSQLDPNQMNGQFRQPEGLFLFGAAIARDDITQVLNEEGEDVLGQVKQSYGGGW